MAEPTGLFYGFASLIYWVVTILLIYEFIAIFLSIFKFGKTEEDKWVMKRGKDLGSRISSLFKKEKEAEETEKRLEEEVKAAEEHVKEAQRAKTVEDQKKAIESLENDFNNHDKDLQRLMKDYDEIDKDVDKVRKDVEEINKEVSKYSQTISMYGTKESRQQLLTVKEKLNEIEKLDSYIEELDKRILPALQQTETGINNIKRQKLFEQIKEAHTAGNLINSMTLQEIMAFIQTVKSNLSGIRKDMDNIRNAILKITTLSDEVKNQLEIIKSSLKSKPTRESREEKKTKREILALPGGKEPRSEKELKQDILALSRLLKELGKKRSGDAFRVLIDKYRSLKPEIENAYKEGKLSKGAYNWFKDIERKIVSVSDKVEAASRIGKLYEDVTFLK